MQAFHSIKKGSRLSLRSKNFNLLLNYSLRKGHRLKYKQKMYIKPVSLSQKLSCSTGQFTSTSYYKQFVLYMYIVLLNDWYLNAHLPRFFCCETFLLNETDFVVAFFRFVFKVLHVFPHLSVESQK